MKRKWLHGIIAGMAVLALVVAVGCSSDDDENAVGTMTPEEQMEFLDAFVGDVGSAGGAVMPLLTIQAGAGQWGAFNCDGYDFRDIPLGRLAIPGGGAILTPNHRGPQIAGARKTELADLIQSAIRLASAQNGPTCGYSESADRWEVVVDQAVSGEYDGVPYSADLKMTIYVQYMSPGGYQDVPDETTTGFSQEFDVELRLEAAASDNGENFAVEIDVDLDSKVDITGLNSASAMLNGTSGLKTDVDLLWETDFDPGNEGLEKMTVVGGFDVDMTSTNVRFPTIGDPSATCPTSGRVDADFGIDMAMTLAGDKETMIDDWKMSVVFNSNGTANMSIQSVRTPSVGEQTTVQICEPPLP
ncbi:MAG TPA: hypothetical protein VM118_14725 [Acidobacteriota bacterium]|nr:hypothetical protein [Acidobacteriota bacterium]